MLRYGKITIYILAAFGTLSFVAISIVLGIWLYEGQGGRISRSLVTLQEEPLVAKESVDARAKKLHPKLARRIKTSDCKNLYVGPFFVERVLLSDAGSNPAAKSQPAAKKDFQNVNLSFDICARALAHSVGAEGELQIRGVAAQIEESINKAISAISFVDERTGKETNFRCPSGGNRLVVYDLKVEIDAERGNIQAKSNTKKKSKNSDRFMIARIEFDLFGKNDCADVNGALFEVIQHVRIERNTGRILFEAPIIDVVRGSMNTWAAYVAAKASSAKREELIATIRDPLETNILKIDSKPVQDFFDQFGVSIKNVTLSRVQDRLEGDLVIRGAIPAARLGTTVELLLQALEGRQK